MRARKAFDGNDAPVRALENGWFKGLAPGDVLWLLTGDAEQLVLVIRMAVAVVTPLDSHPKYAVGNSRVFTNTRITSPKEFSETPRAIPISWRSVRSLRFDSTSSMIRGRRGSVLTGPLASMRRLHPDSVSTLATLWEQRKSHSWNVLGTNSRGGGFSVDPSKRREVETAAIAAVTRQLANQGWTVRSVEADRVGYDLHCTGANGEIRVEVKGSSSAADSFIMTRGERTQLTDPSFRVALVSNALCSPTVRLLRGSEVLERERCHG